MKWILLAASSLAIVTASDRRSTIDSKRALDSACYSADDYSASKITQLTNISKPTNETAEAWRKQVYLPTGATASLVSDPVTCAKALAVYNRVAIDSTSTKLYLFQLGSMFVALNPNVHAGEWTEHIVLDSKFTVKASFLK